MRVLPIVTNKLTSLRGISSVDRSRRRNLNHLQRLRFANGQFILQEPESASYGKICYGESMKQLKLWTPLSIFDPCGTPLRILNGACSACSMGLDYKFLRGDLDGHTYHFMNVLGAVEPICIEFVPEDFVAFQFSRDAGDWNILLIFLQYCWLAWYLWDMLPQGYRSLFSRSQDYVNQRKPESLKKAEVVQASREGVVHPGEWKHMRLALPYEWINRQPIAAPWTPSL